MKVKKGDQVLVIAGKDAGKTGAVIRSLPSKNKVVVEKVAICIKHVKEKQGQPGGRIHFEAAIDSSNVKIICPSCKKATRVGYQVPAEGKKYRVCKKCGESVESSFKKS